MTLTKIRALLSAHGYKTNAELDRVDVKRDLGAVTGVEVMFTDGRVAFLDAG
ncbi:hypothetical protein [Curtobacterium flaccumfaciens]|uniref:hypothetical protein n=1 Tax=Curtobacterium flaccumfaciens TaxID=2035 RepID=UPI00188A4AA9|nr:hypothetical protein [Curtobacterium flaccumfaciens]MBF4628909.1 hypothetical protein [Curtobacterium flaccumfaciens]